MKIDDIDQALMSQFYDWESSDGQILRRLTDFELADELGNPIDMHISRSERPVYRARGTLLSKPGVAVEPLTNIELYFGEYSIDFGLEQDDPSRGYWICCAARGMRYWYKLEQPRDSYRPWYDSMALRIEKLLELHDVLEFESRDVPASSPFYLRRDSRGFIIVPYQVQFYHAKVGGCFDLDFCERDGAFVKDHLKAFVVGTTFFKSMRRGVIVNHQPSAAKRVVEKSTGSKKRAGGFKSEPEEMSKKDRKAKAATGKGGKSVGSKDSKLKATSKASGSKKRKSSSSSPFSSDDSGNDSNNDDDDDDDDDDVGDWWSTESEKSNASDGSPFSSPASSPPVSPTVSSSKKAKANDTAKKSSTAATTATSSSVAKRDFAVPSSPAVAECKTADDTIAVAVPDLRGIRDAPSLDGDDDYNSNTMEAEGNNPNDDDESDDAVLEFSSINSRANVSSSKINTQSNKSKDGSRRKRPAAQPSNLRDDDSEEEQAEAESPGKKRAPRATSKLAKAAAESAKEKSKVKAHVSPAAAAAAAAAASAAADVDAAESLVMIKSEESLNRSRAKSTAEETSRSSATKKASTIASKTSAAAAAEKPVLSRNSSTGSVSGSMNNLSLRVPLAIPTLSSSNGGGNSASTGSPDSPILSSSAIRIKKRIRSPTPSEDGSGSDADAAAGGSNNNQANRNGTNGHTYANNPTNWANDWRRPPVKIETSYEQPAPTNFEDLPSWGSLPVSSPRLFEKSSPTFSGAGSETVGRGKRDRDRERSQSRGGGGGRGRGHKGEPKGDSANYPKFERQMELYSGSGTGNPTDKKEANSTRPNYYSQHRQGKGDNADPTSKQKNGTGITSASRKVGQDRNSTSSRSRSDSSSRDRDRDRSSSRDRSRDKDRKSARDRGRGSSRDRDRDRDRNDSRYKDRDRSSSQRDRDRDRERDRSRDRDRQRDKDRDSSRSKDRDRDRSGSGKDKENSPTASSKGRERDRYRDGDYDRDRERNNNRGIEAMKGIDRKVKQEPGTSAPPPKPPLPVVPPPPPPPPPQAPPQPPMPSYAYASQPPPLPPPGQNQQHAFPQMGGGAVGGGSGGHAMANPFASLYVPPGAAPPPSMQQTKLSVVKWVDMEKGEPLARYYYDMVENQYYEEYACGGMQPPEYQLI